MDTKEQITKTRDSKIINRELLLRMHEIIAYFHAQNLQIPLYGQRGNTYQDHKNNPDLSKLLELLAQGEKIQDEDQNKGASSA